MPLKGTPMAVEGALWAVEGALLPVERTLLPVEGTLFPVEGTPSRVIAPLFAVDAALFPVLGKGDVSANGTGLSPRSSRICWIAKKAALAFKVSKMVSTSRISAPPSSRARVCSP